MGLGLTSRLALAGTPGAAWALARHGEESPAIVPRSAGPDEVKEVLAGLPVAALRLDPDIVEALVSFGLDRIGTLYPLDPGALAKRFGPAPRRRLEQAFGFVQEPVISLPPPLPREARRAFAEPISTVDAIHAATEALLEDLCRNLSRAGEGVRRMRLVCHRGDGARSIQVVGTSRPVRRARLLMNLFSGKLERIDPGFGIEEMVLSAEVVEVVEEEQEDWFARAEAAAAGRGGWTGGAKGGRAAARSWPASSTGWGTASGSEASPVRFRARAGCPSARSSCVNPWPHPGGSARAGRRGVCRPLRLLSPPERVEAVARESGGTGACGCAGSSSAGADGGTGCARPRGPSGWSANGGWRTPRPATTTWPKTRKGGATGSSASGPATPPPRRAGSCTGSSRERGRARPRGVPPRRPRRGEARRPWTGGYAELQVTSNFSFLRGASQPEELVERAHALGYRALALTDRNTLAGVVRAHHAAREMELRFIPGARLDLEDGPSLLCLPVSRKGYGRLARLITLGRRRAPKGECRLHREDVVEAAGEQVFIALPPEVPGPGFAERLAWYRERLDAPLFLAATCSHRGNDVRRLAALASLSETERVPLVATGDVHQHIPERRRLHDLLTCIRERCTIDTAGWRLAANAERHLKSPAQMAALFRDHPRALANAVEIAERCRFSLGELRYEYPEEVVGEGRTPQRELEILTRRGAARRYPEGIPSKVRATLEHELALIGELEFAPYFLTVADIVRTARGLGILCQGRGSAANSAVCYCLEITSVDPDRIDLLFERFISAERGEVPDIDVDFEHERREEVIQYIYRKYGRERAGLAATVVTYRVRSALRDTGRAMGLSKDTVDRLLSMASVWSKPVDEERAREEGFDPTDRRLRLTLELARELQGFPRHLSQHTGGFVISRGPLCEIVPIENAAMEDRTVIEWNKDDLEALGLIKVDVLGLGMLSCIRRSFELLEAHYGVRHTLGDVPAEDPGVYGMIQRADTIGVFQIESRAQMAMLPRLKPATFYDLVIEVAIVRPGPIQGDMVHPYLRRRRGVEPVEYPSEELREVLGKTLGVPLFQEQAMKIAIVGAGFSPAEADQLRRAMASFRNYGTIHRFRDKFVEGMVGRGYDREFAERCFRQIEGFGDYGFPESHAASFALLVYISSWLKHHYPEVFACALLNSQPMGFYAPAQLVGDARRHGVEVRPVDVNHSEWDCTLEPVGPHPPGRDGSRPRPRMALRLGLRQIRGLREEDATRIVTAREEGYRSPADLRRRAGTRPAVLTRLARADAFTSTGLDRRQAAWAIRSLDRMEPLPLFDSPGEAEPPRPEPALPAMSAGEQVVADYRTTGLSLKQHPTALLRERLADRGVRPASHLEELPAGARVTVAGIVLVRQRPGTAGRIVFVTLEDETGSSNLVVFPSVQERCRRALLTARLMVCRGRLEKEQGVIHVIADRIDSLNDWLDGLAGRPGAVSRGAFVGRGRFFH